MVVNQIQHITEENFDDLMSHYYEEIFYYVYKQIEDIEEAKDMTQDIFLKLFKHRRKYDHTKSSIRTWLYRIAQHHSIDYLKSAYKKNKLRHEVIDNNLASDEDILEKIINADQVEIILTIMGETLNKKHLKIMNLYFFSELSVNEIAETQSLPNKTVYNAISESIKKIKKRLEVRV